MKTIIALFIGIFILSLSNSAGESTFSLQLESDTSRLRLIFAGDIMGHDSQIASALDNSTNKYSYDTCFSLLKPYIEKADIALANLEVTLAGTPYKGYPQFSSPDELADALKNAGFDILLTANNHSLDRRKKGLERTIESLDEKGIIRTGTFRNKRMRAIEYPLIIEKNSIRIAILNYTYGTNGLKIETPNIVNYIDKKTISDDLIKAETAKPDFIIATIHWGLEYQREENEEQQSLAKFILDNGADAVIGSHPHVVQPVKTYYHKSSSDSSDYKIIVYSLGNFISNQRKRYTDGGILFELDLIKAGNTTRISNYSYLPSWVHKADKHPDGKHFILLPGNTDHFTRTMKLSEEDSRKMNIFLQDTREHLKEVKITEFKF